MKEGVNGFVLHKHKPKWWRDGEAVVELDCECDRGRLDWSNAGDANKTPSCEAAGCGEAGELWLLSLTSACIAPASKKQKRKSVCVCVRRE